MHVAKFLLSAYGHPKKVLVEEFLRTKQRGLPSEVIQNKVTTKSKIAEVKGTVKATVLDGCPSLSACPIVAALVYDTKSVHFLSTCVTKI